MTGFDSKRQAALDKNIVTDIDGHVVRDARKPKKAAALDRDAEIQRLNEKIEFLARTNMLYSDWEHRETQVTSDPTYHCPECGRTKVTTEHHQMFMVNGGEHYCHSMKTLDSDSPATCLDCRWTGRRDQLKEQNT